MSRRGGTSVAPAAIKLGASDGASGVSDLEVFGFDGGTWDEDVSGLSAGRRFEWRGVTTKPRRRIATLAFGLKVQHQEASPAAGTAKRRCARSCETQGADHRKRIPIGIKIPAHYRVRNDTIDAGGTVTLRHNSRLHHIGLGTAHRGTRGMLLIDDLHVRVIRRDTGQLIRELILNPNRDYQPRGLPPGPPKRPPECNNVPSLLSTVSRDITRCAARESNPQPAACKVTGMAIAQCWFTRAHESCAATAASPPARSRAAALPARASPSPNRPATWR